MKILVLGHTGKMGTALMEIFPNAIGKNSKDFDAKNHDQVEAIIKEVKPRIVFNCVAKLGINPCESDGAEAFELNSMYPRLLAYLSNRYNFLLIHFSTEAIFEDSKHYITESKTPSPKNIYGATKYIGDMFVEKIANKYYIIRLSVLFGPISKSLEDSSQYVENLICRYKNGERDFRIATDVTISPGYTMDIAETIREMIDCRVPSGLYHVTNGGYATLYSFTKNLFDYLEMDVNIEPCKICEFYPTNIKNKRTPMKSEKMTDLRDWEIALKDYCEEYGRQILDG